MCPVMNVSTLYAENRLIDLHCSNLVLVQSATNNFLLVRSVCRNFYLI